jgi:hypothetical protein
LSDGAAAEEAFRARPSPLTFSEMLMVDILSVDGVASRELVDGSFLTEAVAGVFLVVDFGVEVMEDERAEPEGAETDGGQKLVRLIKKEQHLRNSLILPWEVFASTNYGGKAGSGICL